MKKYIGAKLIHAVPAIRKGGKIYLLDEPIPKTMEPIEDGYKVIYSGGYESWSPKDVFEKAYMQIGDNNTITQELVDGFIKNVETTTMGGKTTVVRAELINGFVIVDSSSCVDPSNYDEKIGKEICLERIKNKIWELLGFVLQTATHGI